MAQSSSDGQGLICNILKFTIKKNLIFANYTLIISYSANEHGLHNGLVRRANYFENNQKWLRFCFKSGKEIHTQVLMKQHNRSRKGIENNHGHLCLGVGLCY